MWSVYGEMPGPKIDSHDSFLHLYVECEESLRGFVRSLLPTLEDAREVMQETAAVLWKKYDQLDDPKNFRRWAFGVARFEVLAYRRDKARDRHIFGEELITNLHWSRKRLLWIVIGRLKHSNPVWQNFPPSTLPWCGRHTIRI